MNGPISVAYTISGPISVAYTISGPINVAYTPSLNQMLWGITSFALYALQYRPNYVLNIQHSDSLHSNHE